MTEPSSLSLVASALGMIAVSALVAAPWIYLAHNAWQSKKGRAALLAVLVIMPMVPALLSSLGVDSGLTWHQFVEPFQPGAANSSAARKGALLLNQSAEALGYASIALLVLAFPALAIQAAISGLWTSIRERDSMPRLVVSWLRPAAILYVLAVVLLIGSEQYATVYDALAPSFVKELLDDSLLLTLVAHISLLVAPPVICFRLTRYFEESMDMTPREARELIAKYGRLLEDGLMACQATALPASKARLKRAFRVMVPIAIRDQDAMYLNAMSVSYPLLACFASPGATELEEAILLQVEWKELVGERTSVANEADSIRAEMRRLGGPAEVQERMMQQLNSAELKANNAVMP